jgi:myo-inositol 2-dehydrogenase/D-chiro-inositol 1-dehydrogenase
MKNIRIGIVGLGRLGRRHAENLTYRVRGADLVAACSLVPEELEWARSQLGVEHGYETYEEMLADRKVDAVFLVTSTSEHANQIIAGLEAGYHVFCEKPVALNVEDCLRVEQVVAAHPDRIFLLGFVRRFDPSYRAAKKKIDEGAIGAPFLVRSQTADMDETAEFQVEFTKTSGGIFLDCNVHDVDLARWLLGSEVEQVYAIGGCYAHPGFEVYHDADNTTALCRFTNGAMANISASRTAMHGHDTITEIVGTKGKLVVGNPPAAQRLDIYDEHGARNECVRDFYERFEDAFLIEAQEFVNCIADQRQPTVTAHDGTQATAAAVALTESYRQKKMVNVR